MKYPVESCPECGSGDAEEDAKGVGLILGFHPQDPNRKKLPGTICFIGCTHCKYVGPIVLCPNGISEKKTIAAWDEHIKPGSTISTADLVLELSGREGVTLYTDLNPDENVTICSDPNDFEFVEGIQGPAKILVVKG